MLRGGSLLCRKYARPVQHRLLNLQEYQSKTLLRDHGCTVQNFFVADSAADATAKMRQNEFVEYVVKAQVLAGGRGKGQIVGAPCKNLSGIFISTNKTEVVDSIDGMLNRRLVTKQTTADGMLIRRVMVAESIEIKRETYLAILVDRESNGPVVVASPTGGINIEEIATSQPDLILKEPIAIDKGIQPAQCEKIARFLQFSDEMIGEVSTQIRRLYDLFIEVDATQVEINPLAESADKRVYCVDAKLNFDDNAAFRQRAIYALDNTEGELNVCELEAKKYHLNYIGLDGDIACLVNGAGLAMATMDLIQLHGGRPANFLDVGGTVTEEQVFNAFRILMSDRNMRAIFVNIFGGIVNCATIANGLIQALRRIDVEVPVVVRMEGTNVGEAYRLLDESGLPLHIAHGLTEAACEVVAAAVAHSDLDNKTQASSRCI